MRRKKLTIVLLTLALTLALLPMSAFAAQRNVAADSKASITVNGAVKDDELAAYKVIDITYDANTNSLSYAWNSQFADYFAGTNLETFAALHDDSDDLKNLLAGLPKYIAERPTITPVDTETVAADGTATFAGLAMGEYFIRPTSTTSVYQLMLQKIEPTIVDGKYVIDDVTFAVKKVEVKVTKAADKGSVTKGEKVTYTVTVDIPTYGVGATDKSFYVADKLPDGLTLDTSSIKAQIDGVDVAADAYTLDTTATDTFKLSVATSKYDASWSPYGGKQLVITYTATLNNDDTTEVNTEETNKVTFDYSNYPYVADSHAQKYASVAVTTFAIKIDKYKSGDSTKKLAGAKFDLYRTATSAEINANPSSAVTIPHTSVKGIKLEVDKVTDENGSATFAKYEANGTNYNYYLVETQAPAGYNILDNAVQVNFTAENVDNTTGVYTVQVLNSDGFTLPVTGGTGTVIFTLIGIVLMAGAVALFVISRIKKQS